MGVVGMHWGCAAMVGPTYIMIIDIINVSEFQTLHESKFESRWNKLLSGKSFQIQECLKTQSGEESSSSGRFQPCASSSAV